MSVIRFSSFKINNVKEGQIQASGDGYYEAIIGGLNIHNSAGAFYTYEGARELFEGSGTLRRRIQSGSLKGEVGHPIKEPGMTGDQFLERWIEIRDTNICVQYADIWLDTDRIKDEQGRGIIAVVARLTPSGVHGDMLKKSLENNKENVAFSVRGFTEDKQIGNTKMRTLRTVITYDNVNEGGISVANKFKTAQSGLGNLSGESLIATPMFDKILTENDLRCIERRLNDQGNGLTGENLLNSLQDDLRQILPRNSKPIFTKW